MKKTKLVLSFLVFFILCGLNIAGAANKQITDRDLFLAVQSNNLERFQGYLAGNANWHARDGRGNTLIHALIAPEMIRIPEPESPPGEESRHVVTSTRDEAGNPVSIQRSTLATPRVISVRPIKMQMFEKSPGKKNSSLQKRMDIIRSLVGHGVDINEINERGETPIKLAVYMAKSTSMAFSSLKQFPGGWTGLDTANPESVLRFTRLLLNLGANPNIGDAKGQTPIFDATGELIPLLLKYGVDLENRDQNGMTPFLAADPKKALALLKLGADPQATDNRKRNRWHYLDFADWEELAQKLSELRVNINQRDKKGQTPLLFCCQKGNIKQVKFLAENGADPALADNDGDTLPHHAAAAGNLELLEWLLRNGASVNARNLNGQTPLYYARNNEKSAELLLRYKADPNIPDYRGNSILHRLVENGNPRKRELLSFFIRHGVSLDQKNGNGETPLSRSFYLEDIETMKVLLENGADPNISGPRGWSLLDRAEMHKRPDSFLLLRKHGARRQRSWWDRYKKELLTGLAFLGIIPLFTFLFSLYKLSPFTRETLVVFPCSRRVRAIDGYWVFCGGIFFRRRGRFFGFDFGHAAICCIAYVPFGDADACRALSTQSGHSLIDFERGGLHGIDPGHCIPVFAWNAWRRRHFACV